MCSIDPVLHGPPIARAQHESFFVIFVGEVAVATTHYYSRDQLWWGQTSGDFARTTLLPDLFLVFGELMAGSVGSNRMEM